MTEPERDNKAEQQPSPKENKQESKQLLKRQWDEILTRNKHIFAPINTCLLFVTALAAVGLNAYYGGHHIVLNVISALCVLLLLAILSIVIWYLRPLPQQTITEKAAPGKRGRSERFTKSFIGKCLSWIGDSRIVRFFTVGFYIYNTVDAVRTFPRHPRGSLTTIVICLAGGLLLAVFWVAGSIQEQIGKLWKSDDRMLDFLDGHLEIIKSLSGDIRTVAKNFDEYLNGMVELEPLRKEANASSSAALRALLSFVIALNDKVNLLKEPPSEPPSERDQEPPKIGT
jgi:hypothetical protein